MPSLPAAGLRSRITSHEPRRLVRAAGAVTAAAVSLTAVAAAITLLPPDLSTIAAVGAGMAAIALVALAAARYALVAGLAFALFPIVKFEPAPSDLIFAVLILVAVLTGRFRLARVPVSALSAVGLLIGINLLSLMNVIEFPTAARFFAITVYLAAFALWLASYVDSEARARQVIRIYLAGAVASAIVTVTAMIVDVPWQQWVTAYDVTRGAGLFKDPNVYGPFLVPIAVILLEERMRPQVLRLGRSTSALALAILVLGVLMSYSRAAWANLALAVIVTAITITLRNRKGRGGGRLIGALLAALLITVAAVATTGSLEFVEQRAQAQDYDTERFGAQRAGVAIAQEYPLGVGPGQFPWHHPVESHSTYVRVLAEQGYLGLAALLVFMLATLAMAVRAAVSGRSAFGIGSAALFGAWCGLIFNSIVVDTLHWRHLWLVAALIWVAALAERRR